MTAESTTEKFSRFGFAQTYILPGFLIFVIPVISLLFFLHACNLYESRIRESIRISIMKGDGLNENQKKEQLILLNQFPIGKMLYDDNFAASVDSQFLFEYKMFRWFILLSYISIFTSLAVIAFVLACIRLSYRSQKTLYICLRLSWNVLKLNGAFQALIYAVLLTALSYWVTALWGNVYIPKLIIIVAIAGFVGALVAIIAIFSSPKNEFRISGIKIPEEQYPLFWNNLDLICTKVGTSKPKYVYAGIDDNFFVTESSVIVGDEKITGKLLYVSLPLLKQLNSTEADVILAHEMAHFSGQDTFYSNKMAPLISSYAQYLQMLYENPINLPSFYYMLAFYSLFELSLKKTSRDREYRADLIAAEVTSAHDFVRAMLRCTSYSCYRSKVFNKLFEKDRPITEINLSRETEEGFREFTSAFASSSDIKDVQTSHPFDTHPSLHERLFALGFELDEEKIKLLLNSDVDSGWYKTIHDAEKHEGSMWRELEEQFIKNHEFDLAYRYWPNSEEEKAIVLKFFPPANFGGKKTLNITYEFLYSSDWKEQLNFDDIVSTSQDNSGKITFLTKKEHFKKLYLKPTDFKNEKDNVIHHLNYYYGRHLASRKYSEQKMSISENNS